MSDQNNNTYKSAFFIVPSYIMNLPGLTLGFLKVYETIFQFWNHKKPCFLSDLSLMERANICQTQLYEAFAYFERHGELIRKRRNGKRYFIQPERSIETDCPENEPTSGEAEPYFRQSGSTTSGRAEHNKKNLNKENNKLPCASSAKSTAGKFEIFWNLYPSKKAKKKCEEIWKRRKLDSIAEEIIAKLKIQIETDDQFKRGFIPNPTTYLNQDRWNDEPTISAVQIAEIARQTRIEENKIRLAKQEQISKQQATTEKQRQIQIQKDSQAFRAVIKEKNIPAGLKNLTESLGIKNGNRV